MQTQTNTAMTQTQIAKAIEEIDGPMISASDAARALRKNGLSPDQIVQALTSESGMGMDQRKVAQALYFSSGLDLDIEDVVVAMAKSNYFDASQVAAALHFEPGIDMSLDETVAAMLPAFSAGKISAALYELGDGPVPSITAAEIAGALATAGLKADEIAEAICVGLGLKESEAASIAAAAAATSAT